MFLFGGGDWKGLGYNYLVLCCGECMKLGGFSFARQS